jgi:hypothetical protein
MQEQERLLIGRITRLQTFTVPEFGTRASFRLECAEGLVICCVRGVPANCSPIIAKATSSR